MFDSLDEQIQRDEGTAGRPRRWLRNLTVLLISGAVFAGLYAGIWLSR
jgi:hypothetical protein